MKREDVAFWEGEICSALGIPKEFMQEDVEYSTSLIVLRHNEAAYMRRLDTLLKEATERMRATAHKLHGRERRRRRMAQPAYRLWGAYAEEVG